MSSLILTLLFGTCFSAPSLERTVYPILLQSRGVNGEKVLRVHEDLTLHLQKSSVVADNLTFTVFEDTGEISTVLDGPTLEENLYHDSSHMSSITVSQLDGGKVIVEGILNKNFRIKPRLEEGHTKDGRVAHTVFTYNKEQPGGYDYVAPGERHLSNLENYLYKRDIDERALPETFVLEVHIVTDSDHHTKFKSVQAHAIYLMVLLNSANLRYTTMTKPNVQLRLVGVTQGRDVDFLIRVGNHIDVSATLKEFQKYTVSSGLSRKSDAVILVTGGDVAVCSRDQCSQTSAAGYAYIGVVCTANNVGLIEDAPTAFTGDGIMAHELGHVLGAHHDGDPDLNTVSGKREAQNCKWGDGYFMSYVDGGLKHHQPSPCTVTEIRLHLSTLSATCLAVTSKKSLTKNPNKLPGNVLTEEKFCRKMMPSVKGVYFKKDDHERHKSCKISCCYDEIQGNMRWIRCSFYAMPNGMKCGTGKTCRSGVCAAKIF